MAEQEQPTNERQSQEPGSQERGLTETAKDGERGLERARSGETDTENDVLLDVPNVSVDNIHLVVEELSARVSLDASVVQDFVRLKAGVDVDLGKVDLEITGVQAEAHLRVKLQRVVDLVDHALTTLRERPEIIHSVTSAATETAQALGGKGGALGKGGAIPELGKRADQSAKQLSRQLGISARANQIKERSKSTYSQMKRGFGHIAGKIPGAGGNRQRQGDEANGQARENGRPNGPDPSPDPSAR